MQTTATAIASTATSLTLKIQLFIKKNEKVKENDKIF